MNRKYFEVKELVKQHPYFRLYIFISATGRSFHWHISEPMPDGKFAMLGGIE